MTPEQAKLLREPFPPEKIGKLPKPTKKDNPKGKCKECGGYHGLPAVHLDYCGHAAMTDRLLQVDPEWTWEPMALDAGGLPKLDAAGGLWIKLTVGGVTRPGYGDDTGGKGPKELIGDALRNSAMRFGVALDLWSKEDLRGEEHDGNGEPRQPPPQAKHAPQGSQHNPAPAPTPTQEPKPAQAAGPDSPQDREAAMGGIRFALEAAGLSEADLHAYVVSHYRGEDRQYVASIDALALRMLAHLRGQVANGAVADWLMKRPEQVEA